MREFTIRRDYLQTCTFGVWYDEDDLPIGIKSIEKPWKNNQSKISCIPEGSYLANPFKSPSKSPNEVYLLENTQPRSMIEIHVANFESELLGCIAPGLDFAVMMNKKTNKIEAAVTSSGKALDKLKALTGGYQMFKLSIIGDLQ